MVSNKPGDIFTYFPKLFRFPNISWRADVPRLQPYFSRF